MEESNIFKQNQNDDNTWLIFVGWGLFCVIVVVASYFIARRCRQRNQQRIVQRNLSASYDQTSSEQQPMMGPGQPVMMAGPAFTSTTANQSSSAPPRSNYNAARVEPMRVQKPAPLVTKSSSGHMAPTVTHSSAYNTIMTKKNGV